MFIRWKIEDSEAFRLAYFAEVDEYIQSNPPINEEETHYMVGSNRITIAQAANLSSSFPNVGFYDAAPIDWVQKQDEM